LVALQKKPAVIATPKTGTHNSFLTGLDFHDNNPGEQPATVHEKQLPKIRI
jgi:hypothetical protein